jgi:long-chain fatty acid transport protein
MAHSPAGARHHWLVGFAGGILLVLACVEGSHADGWKVQLQGVKALGVSWADRATIDDATIVWFNAAGMSRLDKPWTLTTASPIVTYGLEFTDGGSTSVLGQALTGASSADGGTTAVVPHLYLVRKINDSWWAGFGFNAPYGLENDYGEAWVGRYHATRSRLAVLNMNPAVAFKVSDRLSLGAGLDVQRSDAQLANMIDFGSLGFFQGLPLTPQGSDGRLELDVADWAIGYDLSLAWDLDARSRLAVTYRSQVEHTLSGDATFTVPAEAQLFTATGQFVNTSATTELPMPRELSVGGSHEPARNWVLLGDFTWTDWSRFDRLTVTFANPLQPELAQTADFEDSFRAAGGVVYRATDSWELRAGGVYESTPVPDATRNPRLPEVDHTAFSVGTTYRVGDRFDFDVSYSHLLRHDAPISLAIPGAGELVGAVRWRVDILAASLTMRF